MSAAHSPISCCTIRAAIWSIPASCSRRRTTERGDRRRHRARAAGEGIQASELHSIVHGTTLVANTVIERTGATVGLITRKAFAT